MINLRNIRLFPFPFACLVAPHFSTVIKLAIDCSMTGFADNSRFLSIFYFSWTDERLSRCATEKKRSKLRQFTIEITIICGYYRDVLRWELRWIITFLRGCVQALARIERAGSTWSYVLTPGLWCKKSTRSLTIAFEYFVAIGSD